MRHLITIREKDLRSIIKESVTKVLSEVYQGILDNNGEGELQKAALKNGFNYIAYHNTDNDNLTFFDVRTSGIHFGSKKAADERGEVRYYGSHTNEYFLKIVKPYVIEKDFDWEQQSVDVDFMNDEEYGEWRKEYDPTYYLSSKGFKDAVYDNDGNMLYGRTIEEMLSDKGYDCIIYKNQKEDAGNYSVCMFNPNHIKLASITYDDNGNEIPLERRFDTSTNDVRY